MPEKKKVLILGSSSLLCPYLLKTLQQAGYSGYCCGRRPVDLPGDFHWLPDDAPLPPVERVISLLPLWLLPERLEDLSGCRHLVAFGSTSSLCKGQSADGRERRMVEALLAAEETLATRARQRSICSTLLRPTLIYGGGNDRNITAIARFIAHWRFFPVAWPGTGGRQPVHAADLALAATACLDRPSPGHAAFNLPGGETINYRQMVRRIFVAMHRPPCLLYLPAALPAAILRFAPGIAPGFSPALFRRMNEDLLFDPTPALEALHWRPRPFVPELPDDLCRRRR